MRFYQKNCFTYSAEKSNLFQELVLYGKNYHVYIYRFWNIKVKSLPGLGTTIDVILLNGRLHVGDTVVVAGMEGPIVTQIRELLMPQPLRELRVKVRAKIAILWFWYKKPHYRTPTSITRSCEGRRASKSWPRSWTRPWLACHLWWPSMMTKLTILKYNTVTCTVNNF